MESFQDGGQQNIKSEHNEYPPPIEGSHMNPEMNNFSQSSGEGSIGPDNFSKMSEGMHTNQMQNYPGYRGSYGMGDQHGGIMSGSVDYNNQNSQFSGQFSQTPVRPSYPGMHKPGMSPVRPGMVPPGMGMIPGSYNSSQRMMSGQGMTQSGPTPTLNQLLQTPNSGQRFPGNYGDFSVGQGKGSEIGSGSSYPMPQQGWNGNPRSMASYPQGSMSGTPYRSQAGSMSESRRPSGMSPGPGPGPGYPHQGQYMSPAMAANAQRYMMGQVRPGQMSPMSAHGYNQQMPPHSQMNYSPSMPNQTSQPPNQQQQQQQQQMYHGQQQQPQPPGQPPPQPSPTPSQQQSSSSSLSSSVPTSSSHRPPSSQGTSPKQASPAPPGMADQNSNHSTSSKKSEENTESNRENSHGEEANGENSHGESQGGSQSHLGVAGLRPAPSPAGSTGSRSDTPASNSGNQVGSPMPPRPPSSHLEGQGHTSHSPMATQAGFNQPMMPPPMPGQMGYPGGAGGKMGGPGMVGGQVPPHYQQYNSQYQQAGTFGRQPGMGGMQGGGGPGGMPGGNYPQAMYNGPGSGMGQMGPGGPAMYNNMMSRGMQNYSAPYGPAGPNMPINSQYGSFNSHMGPGQGPGPGPGPGSGPGPGQPSSSPMVPTPMMPGQPSMPAMSQQAMMQQAGAMMPGNSKGAQAAAQAALMAAANSAGARMPGRGMAGSPRMMGPQGSGSPSSNMMNHMVGVGNLGNASLNSMSNQIQQITSSSVTLPSKPSSPAGSVSHGSASGTPTPADSAPPAMNGAPPSGGNNSVSAGETSNLMSPMSGSDTQESSRPSSTATPGQTADPANSTADHVGSDGSGSMPSSDSTSVDSGFHSAADQTEKPPSESTPTHSSSPSNSNLHPATNGPCEERASQDGESRAGRSRADSAASSSSVSASVQTSNTTTAVTAASLGTAVTQSITTPVSSETESSGCQTSASMPMMMSSSNNSNNSTHNGPHYPHPHPYPHPSMGYPMVPHGPGPMPNSHMMSGPGMHHPGMHNNMPGNMPGNMPPYNMPPGSMPSNMPPGSMPSNMPPGSMPSNMPPGSMPSNMPPGSMPSNMPQGSMPGNMPHGSMPNSMPPGGMPNNMPPGGMMNSMNSMPHGGMPNNMPPGNMPPGGMPNNMPPGSMANHMPTGSMPSSMPPRSMGNSVNSNSMGPMNMPPQNNCPPSMPPDDPPEKKKKDEGVMVGAGTSYCEDYENSSSPGWPGMPKATDVTKLYDMGNEMDRRPFLDKLLAFLDEKGTPLTTMPCISKQPLDLYRLYYCVREKGGMVEVNRGKKWKEICTVVNIGSSASAAFTLKKNYIRYLFGFECKYERGGADPAPILAELEAQLEKKREQKKRVPSPGSQSSQDAFQQPPTPNSQMMEGFPGGPGMPPPYIQGPDGQMVPAPMAGHGGMMMPNSMMQGHPSMMGGQPGMPHPSAMGGGSGPGMMGHGPPNSMMMGNSGPAPGMMGPGGMMTAGGAMMGPGGMMGPGMHMGPNSYSGGPPAMMGQGPSTNSSSMGPSPGPPMSSSNSNSRDGSSTTVTATPTSTPSTAPGLAPPTSSSIPLPPSSTPNSRPLTADSVSVQDPFADEPSKSSSPATFQQRPGPPGPSPSPGGFPSPGPPTSSSPAGFVSRPSSASNPATPSFPNGPSSEQAPGFRRPAEGFPAATPASFPGRSENAQFPFGHESSPGHPPQPFRPPSGSSDPAFAPRFPGQQPPFRPPGPGESFSNSQPFAGHAPGFGPRMPGQEGFGSYPSPQHPGVRPPMTREGSFPSGPGGSMSQYVDWSGGMGGMGHMPYPSHLDAHSDYSMSGREGGPWSPMHAQRNYMPPTAPATPPMGPYARPQQRGSPQTREKIIGGGKLHQKAGCPVPNAQFPPKKEIVFPPDSVEAVQPTLTKRRRLTHKDLGPVDAWRLMMALKSGLLAESTWAIDTLNILLFDDSTVAYFNLAHLPGLLEVLTEQFRAALIHIFHILSDKEVQGKPALPSCGRKAEPAENREEGWEALTHKASEATLDKTLYGCDFTAVSRQGKVVNVEEDSGDRAVLDDKEWDHYCRFTTGARHWQKGGGDITHHVVPCFESSKTHQFLTDLFFYRRTRTKEAGKKRKAAAVGDSVHNTDGSVMSGGGPDSPCRKQCKVEVHDSQPLVKEEPISLNGDASPRHHSHTCSQEVHRNNFMKQVEIKQEPRDAEAQRESSDTPPPPVLPDATQDGKGSDEDSVKVENGPDTLNEEMDTDEKPAPPDLTREDGESEVSKDKDETQSSEKENETPEKTETPDDETQPEDEDVMTAEIVAMMLKEHESEVEEEAYRHDEPPLTTIQADQEEVGRRCVAISNIFRSLSCIPGNEALLSKHTGLMLVLGRVLMLHHQHPPRSKAQPAPPLPKETDEKAEEKVEEKGEIEEKAADPVVVVTAPHHEELDKDWATSSEWWWETLEALRENTLVVLANICSHMHMSNMESEVCLPVLDGLLHWMVCPSSAACDPLPSVPSSSQLSPQRLVLEALCKLCIHDDNVDLLLATPPFSRILHLIARLMRLLSERSQPVPREFSIVLLSRLVQSNPVAARAVALQHPSISLFIEFLEAAEQSAMAVASQQGYSVLQSNPEVMGTSLDMLRRAASTLLHMARVPENRKLFLHHQSRLLTLVMSQILDAEVTQVISDVLYECSQAPLPPT
ncbi:AT-rich interactive domain-containing protein 1A-like isoform X2 [Littorina saxatilis]|uniref:AT-rich interactive domain-containing protein 1A-like isoform X2 n=1 Tax=Littorina saxatilis TaxID=31220 RepID=UPI0038B5613D